MADPSKAAALGAGAGGFDISKLPKGTDLFKLLAGACTIAVGYFSALVAAGLARDLRRYVFRKVESFSNAEIDTFGTSSLITRSTNDIVQIQTTVMLAIRMAFYAPIMGVGAVILALRTSVSMSWLIAGTVVVLIAFIITIFSVSLPKFALIQKLLDRLNLVTSENLSGMMVIRAFNTQAFEEQRFDQANHAVTDTNLFVKRVMAFMLPVMMLIMNGLTTTNANAPRTAVKRRVYPGTPAAWSIAARTAVNRRATLRDNAR